MDDDQEPSGQITYSINDIEPSDITKLMTVNKYTGALVLLKSVESLSKYLTGSIFKQSQSLNYYFFYIGNNVYQFFIRATDSGTPPRQSDVPIELFVLSPEDLPPVFLQEDQKFNLTESAPIGTIVTTVKLVSEMETKYKITASEETAKLFLINDKGQISTTGLLDREKQAFHILGVFAYTESSPPLTALTEVYVKVLDENDNAPEFENDLYSARISEAIAGGTPVVKSNAILIVILIFYFMIIIINSFSIFYVQLVQLTWMKEKIVKLSTLLVQNPMSHLQLISIQGLLVFLYQTWIEKSNRPILLMWLLLIVEHHHLTPL